MKNTDKYIYQYLLATDGVNQPERSALQLDPAGVKMDGRTRQDIIRFLRALSAQIRFYDLQHQPQGDWQAFLDALTPGGVVPDDAQLARMLAQRTDWSPHITLLMAFLQVYAYAQKDMNTLPARRLNFYYEEVLRLLRRPAIADQVHVLFELSKNAPPTMLQKGALLKGGKTAAGVPLNYVLDSDYVINQAQIAMLKSSFADVNSAGNRILYKTEDATSLKSNATSWRPFGVAQLIKSDVLQPMETAPVGCAVASPNLFLAEGMRTVTVTMQLRSRTPSPELILKNALDIRLTGEKGWIAPDMVLKADLVPSPSDLPDQKEFNTTLTIEVLLNEAAPAVTAYNAAIHQTRLQTQWPVWTMSLQPNTFLLETMGIFTVTEVRVDVSAKGIRDLVLQNDQALQAPDAPVLPFGSTPRVGSNFYIGSSEAFSKSITSVAVTLQWQDPPADMMTHYAGYENPNINNSKFQSNLFLLQGRQWLQLTDQKQLLFDSVATELPKKIAISSSAIEDKVPDTYYKRQPDMQRPSGFSQQDRQGFLRLELTGPTKADVGNLPAEAPFEAFGHKSYPTIYTKHAIQIGQEVQNVVLPQPPYTPTLSSVSIDYTAGDTFRIDNPNYIDQFFVLDVFGTAESGDLDAVTLIPQHTQQAALYIGLQSATPAQLLSLLVQVEEGSAPGAVLLRPEDVTWSYLAKGQWQTISRADILEDKTDGFQVQGLVRLLLGADATTEHTLMPSGLHWLRAGVNSNADGAASVQTLYTQAARASLQIPEGFESEYDLHLSSSLPANTISSLVRKIPAVKKVTQPYASFGGRPSEADKSYHRRAHERLRHRNRAVSAWDFERLILEAFPGIFKVKCLPHTNIDNVLTPGEVKMVIVPDWRKRATGDPLKPKANGAFLRTVESFIEGATTSTFTNVHVTNPVYETLLVDAKVLFKTGFDPGYHAIVLEEELKRFLSPWAYEEGQDIAFDGRISASEILAFIEGRDYVEHVTDFELYHRHKGTPGGGIGEMQIDVDFIVGVTPEPTIGPSGIGKAIGEDFVIGVPVETAVTTRPDAIMVSNSRHRIGVLSAGTKACEGVQTIGIGQMVVGLDFVVIT